jgi:hypothetical protein
VKVSNYGIYRERETAFVTYVNDLEALLEKLIGLIWEVVLHTVLGGTVGLVDVDSFPWAAELDGPITDVGGGAADCVVKDENPSCSGAADRYQMGIILTYLSKAV